MAHPARGADLLCAKRDNYTGNGLQQYRLVLPKRARYPGKDTAGRLDGAVGQ